MVCILSRIMNFVGDKKYKNKMLIFIKAFKHGQLDMCQNLETVFKEIIWLCTDVQCFLFFSSPISENGAIFGNYFLWHHRHTLKICLFVSDLKWSVEQKEVLVFMGSNWTFLTNFWFSLHMKGGTLKASLELGSAQQRETRRSLASCPGHLYRSHTRSYETIRDQECPRVFESV